MMRHLRLAAAVCIGPLLTGLISICLAGALRRGHWVMASIYLIVMLIAFAACCLWTAWEMDNEENAHWVKGFFACMQAEECSKADDLLLKSKPVMITERVANA